MASKALDEENIDVVIRVRPLRSHEKERGEVSCVKIRDRVGTAGADTGTQEVQVSLGPLEAQVFKCNKCFPNHTSQENVFLESGITDLLDSAIDGYRACAFAFGQTGAGKTYTVIGPSNSINPGDESDGLMSRSIGYIFDKVEATKSPFTVTVSCLEIYSEHVYDLLVDERDRVSLPVREHQTEGFFLEGSKAVECPNRKAAYKAVDIAMRNRHIGEHDMNSRSNRSHCITEINISIPVSPLPIQTGVQNHRKGFIKGDKIEAMYAGREVFYPGIIAADRGDGTYNIDYDDGEKESSVVEKFIRKIGGNVGANESSPNTSETVRKDYIVMGRISLVDLAGSERLKSTKSTGKVLQEAGFINKSLYVLGKVIAGLVRTHGDRNHRDVPYRDSKLTKLLISSLGGAGRTMIVACISEASGSQTETLRTLKFSMSAARIKNKPVRFLSNHDKLVENLREEIRRLRSENMQLRSSLSTAPSMLASSDLSGPASSSYRVEGGGSVHKQALARAYSVQEAVGGHDGHGSRVGAPHMKASHSMKVISNKRGARKMMPGVFERYLATDEDLFLAETRASTAMLEDEEDDSSGAFSVGLGKKFYEPVLKAQRAPTQKKKNKNNVNTRAAGSKPTRTADVNSENNLYSDAEEKSSEDREKIRALEERLERIEAMGLIAAAGDPTKAAAKPKNRKITHPAKQTDVSPSPFLSHIPKYGKQMKEEGRGRGKAYLLPKVVSKDPEGLAPAVAGKKKTSKSAQMESDRQRLNRDNKKLPVINSKLPQNVRGLPNVPRSVDDSKVIETNRISRKSPSVRGVVDNDEDDDIAPQHASVHRKIKELEQHLIKQRQAMEDNPGAVTADEEAAALALEKEVRAMRIEVDISTRNPKETAASSSSSRGSITKTAARSEQPRKQPPGRVQRIDPPLKREGSVTAAADAPDGVPTPRGVKNAAAAVSETAAAKMPVFFYKVNDKIEALYNGQDIWYPGTVSEQLADGSYYIRYDDGEMENGVKEELIRMRKTAEVLDHPKAAAPVLTPHVVAKFKKGEKIEALYNGKDIWYPGSIGAHLGGGLYRIDYDDGEIEEGVKDGFIRYQSTAAAGPPAPVPASITTQPGSIDRNASNTTIDTGGNQDEYDNDFNDDVEDTATDIAKIVKVHDLHQHTFDKEKTDEDGYGDEDFEDDFEQDE